MTTASRARLQVSLDPADRWVGRYLGPAHLSLCPLPTVVIRVRRRATAATAVPGVAGGDQQ
jgi:hypothetical protein